MIIFSITFLMNSFITVSLHLQELKMLSQLAVYIENYLQEK